ncbi:NAD-dependent malic enzyme [Candidatus Aerophobetes bacterium]|uniref:Malolactic enzyme n=1 Tax=Aerophobetes bacterium TaxID=2030807 RepID=A0A2A4X2E9_UNCAE|nr:MAG: NAD-dependent malic enzyme [Candidatus Aerophobetes bacterium]
MSQGSLQKIRSKELNKDTCEVENPCHITSDSVFNKGAAFTHEEREELGLKALFPTKVISLEEQIELAYAQFQDTRTGLDKYIFLRSIQDENEVLYYALVSKYIYEMMPCIYTPTVGTACQKYHRTFLKPRGIYLSLKDKGNLKSILSNLNQKRVDAIVVTDGEGILGLGDLGTGGMAISIGKLALYTALGGVNPAYTLPITLDVGTNNAELLADKYYPGIREKRVTGAIYDSFIEEFVQAVKSVFPEVLLQWEDFGKTNASRVLAKYKDVHCSFNDDIQGTASVVFGGLFAAFKASNQVITDQRVVIFGGGTAGIGVADYIVTEMKKHGMSESAAKSRIYVLGRKGLAHTQSAGLDELKKPYAQPVESLSEWSVANKEQISLEETVAHVKPTILIGTSTVAGSFTESIIKTIAKHVERPIIFPLSNPTSKCEALPADILKWTEGRAIVGTGSPFDPVSYGGSTYTIGQCNNVYIFPGVGRGIIASKSKKVTDEMFVIAAKKLSEYSPLLENKFGSLYPKLSDLNVVSLEIAKACGKHAIEKGYSDMSENEFEDRLKSLNWAPVYCKIKKN